MTLYVSLGLPSSPETDAGGFLENSSIIKELCSFLLPPSLFKLFLNIHLKCWRAKDLMDWRWQFSVLLITRQICQSESWSEIDIHIKFLNNGKTSGVLTMYQRTTHHPSSHPASLQCLGSWHMNTVDWCSGAAISLSREDWGGGERWIFQEETSRFLSVTW